MHIMATNYDNLQTGHKTVLLFYTRRKAGQSPWINGNDSQDLAKEVPTLLLGRILSLRHN